MLHRSIEEGFFMLAIEDSSIVPRQPLILWDGYGLGNPYSGIGRHAELLRSELRHFGLEPLTLKSGTSLLARFKPFALMSSQIALSQRLKNAARSRVVVHGLSNYNLPKVKLESRNLVRSVLTVHDLIPEILPNQVSQFLSFFLKYQMPRSLARTDAIICVSAWTRSLVEERYPFTRGKTHVIPNGVPESFSDAWYRGWAPTPRFLTVARGESYKRLDLIPTILALSPPEWTWDVVTDSRGVKLLSESSGHLRQGRLRIHQALSEEQLQALFSLAWAYVHPSLLEGYCLPAAQAIATGRPVLYTKSSGIDEVVELAGLGLDPSANALAWVEALGELVANDVYYRALAREQNERAPKWRDVATRTLEVYGIL
jgi:glycosyltransferase involved in cell wall biosynthesis